jgi:hypothetical protein
MGGGQNIFDGVPARARTTTAGRLPADPEEYEMTSTSRETRDER